MRFTGRVRLIVYGVGRGIFLDENHSGGRCRAEVGLSELGTE